MILLPRTPGETAAELAAGLRTGRALRLVNFHATPRSRSAEYRAQVAALAARYAPLPPGGVDALMDGRHRSDRPVVVPIVFEGFRDGVDVLVPLLNEVGLKAWFFVPSHFPNVPAPRQRAFAARNNLLYGPDEYPGERIAMSWAELRALRADGHLIACHSRNHTALRPDTPDAVLHDEIVAAKREMEDGLGGPVDTFCYLYGAEYGLNPRADALLIEAGYRFLLSNFRIQRLQ